MGMAIMSFPWTEQGIFKAGKNLNHSVFGVVFLWPQWQDGKRLSLFRWRPGGGVAIMVLGWKANLGKRGIGVLAIHKAILHIMDFNSGLTVLSEGELDVQSPSVINFLSRHLEKCYTDQGAKTGEFEQRSLFRQQVDTYLAGKISFQQFSVFVAERLREQLSQSDELASLDLVICDFSYEGRRCLALLKCNNQVGYTHQVVQEEGGVRNEIINHYAILPSLTQKLEEYAFIDGATREVSFVDKPHPINGEAVRVLSEQVLECNSRISPRDTMRLVGNITRKVAEKHGQSAVAAVAKAKTCMIVQAEQLEKLDPATLGQEIFHASPLLQEEYRREAETAGLTEAVRVDKEFARKKGQTHKIKTDTGIEISFPVDYFQNTQYMEFINNPNGTISIELKNIGKISNR